MQIDVLQKVMAYIFSSKRVLQRYMLIRESPAFYTFHADQTLRLYPLLPFSLWKLSNGHKTGFLTFARVQLMQGYLETEFVFGARECRQANFIPHQHTVACRRNDVTSSICLFLCSVRHVESALKTSRYGQCIVF